MTELHGQPAAHAPGAPTIAVIGDGQLARMMQTEAIELGLSLRLLAAAAGIGLINSLGNLGGFTAPILRSYFDETVGGNSGLYVLAVGAVLGAILFAITGLFKKANEIALPLDYMSPAAYGAYLQGADRELAALWKRSPWVQ